MNLNTLTYEELFYLVSNHLYLLPLYPDVIIGDITVRPPRYYPDDSFQGDERQETAHGAIYRIDNSDEVVSPRVNRDIRIEI